jgi:hypothetical protein
MLAEQGEAVIAAPWFWKSAVAGDLDFRRTVAAALAKATHPMLVEVAIRVRCLLASSGPEVSSAFALAP